MAFHFPDRLYPIVDAESAPRGSPTDLTAAILAAGARFVQLRVKASDTRTFVEIARAVKPLTDRACAALIINDRADVARLVDAAGVHLGQDDLPPLFAREILGPDKIIGFSIHSMVQAGVARAAAGIDYVAFGPIFSTASKRNPDPVQGLETLRQVRRICELPLVAIGGITAQTVDDVLAAGADSAAVISAIAHADDPRQATIDLLERARRACGRDTCA